MKKLALALALALEPKRMEQNSLRSSRLKGHPDENKAKPHCKNL